MILVVNLKFSDSEELVYALFHFMSGRRLGAYIRKTEALLSGNGVVSQCPPPIPNSANTLGHFEDGLLKETLFLVPREDSVIPFCMHNQPYISQIFRLHNDFCVAQDSRRCL